MKVILFHTSYVHFILHHSCKKKENHCRRLHACAILHHTPQRYLCLILASRVPVWLALSLNNCHNSLFHLCSWYVSDTNFLSLSPCPTSTHPLTGSVCGQSLKHAMKWSTLFYILLKCWSTRRGIKHLFPLALTIAGRPEVGNVEHRVTFTAKKCPETSVTLVPGGA